MYKNCLHRLAKEQLQRVIQRVKDSIWLVEGGMNNLTHLHDSKPAVCRPWTLFCTNSTKQLTVDIVFANEFQTFQSPVSLNLQAFLSWQTSGALWLAGFGEFALQEHSGNTKPLLLVDRLSQDVVVSDRLEARLLKHLRQELWKQTEKELTETLEGGSNAEGRLSCFLWTRKVKIYEQSLHIQERLNYWLVCHRVAVSVQTAVSFTAELLNN